MQFNIHTHYQLIGKYEILDMRNLNTAPEGWFSAAIHPWDALSIPTLPEVLLSKANSPQCLAIGETGLDKVQGPSMEIQESCFLQHIELSESLELPLIIHCVRAWNELINLRKRTHPKTPWIIHGFNKPGVLNELLREGFYLSIGPAVLQNEKLQSSIPHIPLDRLFLETDDTDHLISEIYEKVAALKRLSLQQLEERIEQNFKNVFRKWTTG